MEPSRFDELTKALATSTSRREALKTIAATTLGGLLGLGGIGTAFGASTCHRNGLGCDTNSQCCSGYCANGEKCTCPPAPACNSICPCPSGQSCVNGTCCPTSQVCNGVCCATGQTCVNGTCCATANVCGSTCLAAPCAASQCLKCDAATGTCVSTCGANQVCQNGQCV